jgi:hypothetical protein
MNCRLLVACGARAVELLSCSGTLLAVLAVGHADVVEQRRRASSDLHDAMT